MSKWLYVCMCVSVCVQEAFVMVPKDAGVEVREVIVVVVVVVGRLHFLLRT